MLGPYVACKIVRLVVTSERHIALSAPNLIKGSMMAAQAWERSDAQVLLYRPAADHAEGWLTAGG